MTSGEELQSAGITPLKIVFLLAYLAGVVAFWYADVDDAFIGYRYVDNLVAGNGLVFNVGDKVEGFSNALWVFVLAAFHFVGFPIILTAKTLSALAGAATLGLTLLGLEQLVLSRVARWGALLLLAASGSYLFWAVSGMETMFYMLLLIWGTIALMREVEQKKTIWSSVPFALAAITRPEGVLFFTLASIATIVVWKKRKHVRLLPWLASGLVIILALYSFRIWYFHEILPMPVIAKGDSYGTDIAKGALYLEHWAADHIGFTAAAALGIILAGRKALRQKEADNRKIIFAVLLSIVALQAVFTIAVGGDWMSFSRFVAPVLPQLALFAGLGLGHVFSRTRVAGIIMLALAAQPIARLPADVYLASWRLPLTLGNLGQCLHSAGVANQTVIIEDIGAFAYFSKLSIADGHGLIHKDVALYNRERRLHDENEHWLKKTELLLQRHPSYIVAISYDQTIDAATLAKYKAGEEVPRYILPPDAHFAYVGMTSHSAPDSPSGASPYYVVFREQSVPANPRWNTCLDQALVSGT